MEEKIFLKFISEDMDFADENGEFSRIEKQDKIKLENVGVFSSDENKGKNYCKFLGTLREFIERKKKENPESFILGELSEIKGDDEWDSIGNLTIGYFASIFADEFNLSPEERLFLKLKEEKKRRNKEEDEDYF